MTEPTTTNQYTKIEHKVVETGEQIKNKISDVQKDIYLTGEKIKINQDELSQQLFEVYNQLQKANAAVNTACTLSTVALCFSIIIIIISIFF